METPKHVVLSYTDLEVWISARSLVKNIYSFSRSFPREELVGLTSQIRRSAVSIPSNIAEGCGRQYPKDSINFFYIARGSLYEVETQCYVAFDLNYIDGETLNNVMDQILNCKRLLHGFINYYEKLKVTNN